MYEIDMPLILFLLIISDMYKTFYNFQSTLIYSIQLIFKKILQSRQSKYCDHLTDDETKPRGV